MDDLLGKVEEKYDDDGISEEQVEEYREMLVELGPHPDKVLINTLSMVAEDHAKNSQTASLLYTNIRSLLTTSSNNADHKLPLVYVIDSILKNVGGEFISLVEKDANEWIPIVHTSFSARPEYRLKLKKVLSTWKDSNLFSLSTLKAMNTCFEKDDAAQALAAAKVKQAENKLSNLSSVVKKEMQSLLNDLYQNENELDKLSLERLAVVNTTLFSQIQSTAEGSLKTKQSSNQNSSQDTVADQQLFVENRPMELLQISRDWQKTEFSMDDAHSLISNLQSFVRDGSLRTVPYSPSISLLSSASATANHLTTLLQKQALPTTASAPITTKSTTPSLKVDKTLFTTEGITKMSHTYIVAKLYHQGLPFLSSADGRRFATQLELSYHLDKLFQKSQIEKTMERKEERGWYISTSQWTLAMLTTTTNIKDTIQTQQQSEEKSKPVEEVLFSADEERSKCRICSISFEMIFDNMSSVFMYKNCFEMDVEGMADEKVLVHESCRRGLGCLEYLTMDQII